MAETRILEGRRAIVTGASRGIGAEIARAMARAGAAVVLAARDEEALDRVAAEIEREGGRAVVAPADVSKPDAVERLVATSVNALGGLDIAVNNAAGADPEGNPALRWAFSTRSSRHTCQVASPPSTTGWPTRWGPRWCRW